MTAKKQATKSTADERRTREPRRRVAGGRRPRPGSQDAPTGAKALSLSDLEIPVRRLLTHAEELRSGFRIRGCLDRVAVFLPRHPMGYRRFLARMEEVISGGGLMFTWLSLRERMQRDLELARKALRRSESLAAKDPEKALKVFESGVKILATYPLDPETVYQWSREVTLASDTQPSRGALMKLPRTVKVVRILRELVRVLERERDALVLPNFRLVLKEVFRYHPQGMRRSDLFQEGILGLHKAVFRFDATRGIRFSTYATYWIRQAIRKALIDKARLIRVPQAIQEELRKEENKLNPTEADRVRRIMSETVLFSAGESDDSDDRFSFEVKDSSRPEISEALHTEKIPTAVRRALRRLTNRERDVLQRRFGLGGERPQTLEEIGSLMNLSRERIRQIEREALERMRGHGDLGEIYEDLGSIQGVTNSRS